MTWNQWKTPTRKNAQGTWPGYQTPKNKPKQQEKDTTNEYIGFDGKKVQLSVPLDYGSTSSSSASSQRDQMNAMRTMMRKMAHGEQLSSEEKAMLEVTPEEAIKDEQRDLNKRRRFQKQLRGLKTNLQENEDKYQRFMEKERALIKSEKLRYEEEQSRLSRRIAQLENEESMETEEEDIDSILENKVPHHMMENRMAQAEHQAWHTQQSLIQMQAQLQQFMSYQMSLTPGLPSLPEHTPVAPQPAAAPGMNMNGCRDSPQMPKGVRQNQLKPKEKEREAQKAKDAAARAEARKALAKPLPEAVTPPLAEAIVEDLTKDEDLDGKEDTAEL